VPLLSVAKPQKPQRHESSFLKKSFQALEKLEQILIKLFSKKFKSKKGLKGAKPPRHKDSQTDF